MGTDSELTGIKPISKKPEAALPMILITIIGNAAFYYLTVTVFPRYQFLTTSLRTTVPAFTTYMPLLTGTSTTGVPRAW